VNLFQGVPPLPPWHPSNFASSTHPAGPLPCISIFVPDERRSSPPVPDHIYASGTNYLARAVIRYVSLSPALSPMDITQDSFAALPEPSVFNRPWGPLTRVELDICHRGGPPAILNQSCFVWANRTHSTNFFPTALSG